MTRSLLFIVCALFSLPVFSAIEIAQWVPWSFIQHKLIPSHFEISREGLFDLEASSLRPRINFTAHIRGQSQRTQFYPAGISASHQLNGVIEIDAINIDQWIQRNINGNNFRVYVKVNYSPFIPNALNLSNLS
jgi:hypothetical protein